MKTYKIKFKGCKLGAIGKLQNFTVTIEANDFDDANMKLYDNYEHIHINTVNGKKYDYTNTVPTYGNKRQ